MSGQRIAPINDPVLKSSPLFADLSELEFNAVATFLEPRSIKSGEIIFTEGAAGEEMFILVSGQISGWVGQIEGTGRQMFEIKSGEFFGEMSIIANESRSATLTALTDTELLALHGIDFYRIIFEHPMIGMKMLKTIGRVQNSWLEETSKYLSDLMRWGETARRRAVSDDISGLYNRSFLEESASGRFEQGSVGPRSISLLLLDLDRIHQINSRHGSKAGDRVFLAMGDVLRSSTRNEDICARLSGDEFAVLLPDTGPDEAQMIAERIRQAMASRKIAVPKAPGIAGEVDVVVCVSIGIASAPIHADNWENLFLAADAALRSAKESGRNRVEMAKTP